MAADVWLLLGSIVIGGVVGVLGGLWCVGHPRTRPRARCRWEPRWPTARPCTSWAWRCCTSSTPTSGIVPRPVLLRRRAALGLAVHGSLDVAASDARPVARPRRAAGRHVPAADAALAREITEEDYVRTAVGEGPHAEHRRAPPRRPADVRRDGRLRTRHAAAVPHQRHARRAGLLGPRLLHNVWAAIGHNGENAINLPIIIAAALWMTVLLIVLAMWPTRSSRGSTRACAARRSRACLETVVRRLRLAAVSGDGRCAARTRDLLLVRQAL